MFIEVVDVRRLTSNYAVGCWRCHNHALMWLYQSVKLNHYVFVKRYIEKEAIVNCSAVGIE